MKRYHLRKEDKHDYASPKKKAIRKLHTLLIKICGGREKTDFLYASTHHKKRRSPANKEWNHYMTEEPAYLAGFGHGFGGWRSGLVNAEIFGLKYAYTPMVSPAWDEALGLGAGMVSVDDLLKKNYKKIKLPYYDTAREESLDKIRRIISTYEGENIIFCNEYEQWTKKDDDIRGDKMIRKIFWDSPQRKKDNLLYSDDRFNIAVHIRRGDVESLLKQGDESMRKRWVDLDYYLIVMKQVESIIPKKCCFYIFSEGEEKDFEILKTVSSEVKLCVKMNEQQSFLHICHANMILAGCSSFSIIAGALNYNLKIVPNRDWLTIPEEEEWIKADIETGISESDLNKVSKKVF